MSENNEKKQKKVRKIAKNFVVTVIAIIAASLISGLILIIPGELYAGINDDNKFDANPVLRVQLLLSLKGYNLDFKEIDGKLGPVTREVIKDYQKRNNLSITGDIDDKLYRRLYEDTKPILAQIEHQTYDGRESQSEELNAIKAGLVKTNDALKTLSDNYSYHFITTYRDLAAVFVTAIGIAIALLSSLIAYFLPKIIDNIKNDISNEVRQIHETKVNELEGKHNEILNKSKEFNNEMMARTKHRIYTNLSSGFYTIYRELFNNPSHGAYKSSVELAIRFADHAITSLGELPDGNAEKDDMIKFTQLHKAYHYASKSLIQGQNGDEYEALDIAKKLNDFVDSEFRTNKYIQWVDSKETIAWVLILLGKDDDKKKGELILQELLREDNIPYGLRKEIEENYKKYNQFRNPKIIA